jgi:hypothetical protein
MLAEKSGKFFAQRGERKSQAGAALVAARGADADQSAAGGTDFRTRLLIATAE